MLNYNKLINIVSGFVNTFLRQKFCINFIPFLSTQIIPQDSNIGLIGFSIIAIGFVGYIIYGFFKDDSDDSDQNDLKKNDHTNKQNDQKDNINLKTDDILKSHNHNSNKDLDLNNSLSSPTFIQQNTVENTEFSSHSSLSSMSNSTLFNSLPLSKNNIPVTTDIDSSISLCPFVSFESSNISAISFNEEFENELVDFLSDCEICSKRDDIILSDDQVEIFKQKASNFRKILLETIKTSSNYNNKMQAKDYLPYLNELEKDVLDHNELLVNESSSEDEESKENNTNFYLTNCDSSTSSSDTVTNNSELNNENNNNFDNNVLTFSNSSSSTYTSDTNKLSSNESISEFLLKQFLLILLTLFEHLMSINF